MAALLLAAPHLGHSTPKAPNVVLNHDLTPGATVPVSLPELCAKGHAGSVRPSASESARLKRMTMARYGISNAAPGAYQMDHLISLELGGDPRSALNLWPEPIAQAHRKDKVENKLHDAVCGGRVGLADAQQCEATDWASCPAKFGLP